MKQKHLLPASPQAIGDAATTIKVLDIPDPAAQLQDKLAAATKKNKAAKKKEIEKEVDPCGCW